MKGIIYKITNDINIKVYVGQTWKTVEERFHRHCAEARWYNTKKMPIVLAIKKYGKQHFKIKIIEELINCTQQNLDEKEIFWVKELKTFSPNGYNLRAGMGHSVWSDEVKQKISIANKGRKVTAETIEKLRISHLGHKMKEESKKKLSMLNKGKSLTAEHKEKIGLSNKGKIVSNESKEKMRKKKLKFEYEIISPNGEKLKTNNLKNFSKINQLNNGHMNSVARGKKKNYKGWKVISMRELQSSEKEG